MIDELRSCFPTARVAPMYGLTECKRVSIQGADVPNSARYSVGRALPGTTAWVGDSFGQPTPPGEEGELFVRGPHLMAGYWRNPVATAVRYQDLGGKRTLRSGDIFRMDEAGYLTFVRREGGFLKAKGQRLSPVEIEDSLITLPEVRAAVAVGYVNPDGEDSVAMFLVGDSIDEVRVRQHCARHLQRAAMPTLIHILNEPLPCNANGKYDRRALAAFAQELSMSQRYRR
jgi:acyl-coenzyme A synthetase/AMP-(fatty) acid ligase